MTDTGYSDKTLVQKLGFKASQTVLLFNPPDWFTKYLKENELKIAEGNDTDWAHGFFTELHQLEIFIQFVTTRRIKNGFWVSWPKKASGIFSEVGEQTFRDIILPLNWVDTKVCSIDEIWSGLLFRHRK